MEIDEEILHAVSVALTKGQGIYTQEELLEAYDQVVVDRIAGDLSELVLKGQLHLVVDGDIVKYGAPEGSTTDDLIAHLNRGGG